MIDEPLSLHPDERAQLEHPGPVYVFGPLPPVAPGWVAVYVDGRAE